MQSGPFDAVCPSLTAFARLCRRRAFISEPALYRPFFPLLRVIDVRKMLNFLSS